ncbi:MAG: energy transducer TonB [Bacteroidota bacterium]
MIRHAHRVTLTRFLLLSCGLHLLLLVGHGRTVETTALRRLGQPEISVELENVARSLHVPRKPAVITSYSAPHAPAAPMTSSARESDPGESPVITPVTDAAPGTQPETAAASGNAVRNQLLGELQSRLARYLTYPPLARERGWQGTVLLGLHVESNGRLGNVRLERSSGYAVLDRSALNSLNRLGYLSEAVAWLNGGSVDMQLPVIYRLVEN